VAAQLVDLLFVTDRLDQVFRQPEGTLAAQNHAPLSVFATHGARIMTRAEEVDLPSSPSSQTL
jgi:hypothetical protein